MDNLQEKVVEVNEEVIQEQPKKAKKTSLIVLGVIAVVTFLTIAILSTIMTIDALSTYKASGGNGWQGLGVALIFVLLLAYGTLANLVPIGVSIAGIIVSSKKRKKWGTSKLWTVGFILTLVLPIVVEAINLVLLITTV